MPLSSSPGCHRLHTHAAVYPSRHPLSPARVVTVATMWALLWFTMPCLGHRMATSLSSPSGFQTQHFLSRHTLTRRCPHTCDMHVLTMPRLGSSMSTSLRSSPGCHAVGAQAFHHQK